MGSITVWLYRLLAISGLLLLAGGSARLFGRKTMHRVLAVLILSELVIALLFRLTINGWRLPEPVIKALSYIYIYRCTDWIVFDHHRGRWDDELFYTLRPGEFQHKNMEFSNHYTVNSMGWRDDETSLQTPSLVFLGDSYTMGWGVNQEESFAALLEKELRLTGLNTGVASYGTAREYLTFKKVNRDSCRLLVLQFCPNDVTENRQFIKAGYKLTTSPKTAFEKEIIWNKLHRYYFPLKYTHATLHFFVNKWKSKNAPERACSPSENGVICDDEVADFFNILRKIREIYEGPILVFNLGMGITQPAVSVQFSDWLELNPLPDVYIFPASAHLAEPDYLPLDKHLTAEGNRKLAIGLAGFLREKGVFN